MSLVPGLNVLKRNKIRKHRIAHKFNIVHTFNIYTMACFVSPKQVENSQELPQFYPRLHLGHLEGKDSVELITTNESPAAACEQPFPT